MKEDLKAIIINVGTPTFFFAFSSADMQWPELHALFGNDDNNTTSESRRQNVEVEQGWCSDEWPVFDSMICRHTWVEFVGCLLCSERFFFRYSGFLLSPKTNI